MADLDEDEDLIGDLPVEDEEAAGEADTTPSVEETIEDLRKQIAAERAAKLQEQQARVKAEQRAAASDAEVDDTNLQLVESAIDTIGRDLQEAKQQMAEALRVGDHAGAAEIQSELTDKTLKLQQLENGRDRMREAKSKPQPVQPVQPNRLPSVDEFADQLTPRSADWVRAHPEYVTNPALNARMINAHNFVIADGVAPDTDEYFERVETMLRIRKVEPAAEPETTGAQLAAPRRPAPPAAPANNGGSGGRPNTPRLSAQEREFARDADMTEAEYAANKAKLIKDGRMAR